MRIVRRKAQRGFTLLEMIIAMALMALIAGAIFVQIDTAQQRSSFERTQIDLFQEAREFMDQMSRDVRQSGYPNTRNYDATILTSTAATPASGLPPDPTTSPYLAVGLTQVDSQTLSFEGGLDDKDDTGKVFFTQYFYQADGYNCPCLVRSQQVKETGDPNSMSPEATTEVQNIQNFVNGNDVPIFTYYTNGGTTQVADATYLWGGNSGADNKVLASIDTVRVTLMVQSPNLDMRTKQAPVVTLFSTIRIPNCSSAANGTTAQRMSC